MISSLRGIALSVGLDHAVVEVGGVGLAVLATPATLATLRAGEAVLLHTSLVVREDSLTLYGFGEVDSRDLFVQLQTVSGVGPRLALAALAVLDPQALRSAICEGDLKRLTQVPGIGKKGAERLSLELRDKLTATQPHVPRDQTAGAVRGEVVEALVSLGFANKQAEQTVAGVLDGHGAEAGASDTSSVLRAALSRLGRDTGR